MTYLEKANSLNRYGKGLEITVNFCPDMISLEKASVCHGLTCTQCWNREMLEVVDE